MLSKEPEVTTGLTMSWRCDTTDHGADDEGVFWMHSCGCLPDHALHQCQRGPTGIQGHGQSQGLIFQYLSVLPNFPPAPALTSLCLAMAS